MFKVLIYLIPTLFLAFIILRYIIRSKRHAYILASLQPVREMTEEDCEYFHIIYGKKVPVGAPVFTRRGRVECLVYNRDKHNEYRETTIADIKIDARCEKDVRYKGTDLSFYSDNSFLLEEIKPLRKKLKNRNLSITEQQEIKQKISKLEDEHTNIDLEFTFLNPQKRHKPAFITGIDLWNINPNRIEAIPAQKEIRAFKPKKNDSPDEEIVSFDIT